MNNKVTFTRSMEFLLAQHAISTIPHKQDQRNNDNNKKNNNNNSKIWFYGKTRVNFFRLERKSGLSARSVGRQGGGDPGPPINFSVIPKQDRILVWGNPEKLGFGIFPKSSAPNIGS